MKKIYILAILIHFHTYSQELKINEVMSNNFQTLVDEDGDESDWIELFNPSPNPVLLSNYYLTDEVQFLNKWNFPPVYIPSGGFILVYASSKNKYTDSTFHTNFKLSKSGTDVILSKIGNQIIDAIAVPELLVDISYGRASDGNVNFSFFNTATPKSSNNLSQAYNCILSPPQVSVESGKYASSFLNSISLSDVGAAIKYTLDGKDPLNGINYTNSFLVENIDYPNYLSKIPTNPSLTYPLGDYSQFRADTRGWVPPFSDLSNIVVLKTQAFKDNCISSPIVSKTYLINNQDSLAILSISVDSIGFFSNETGIYVYGNDPLGNYENSGNLWERQVNLSYFNPNKELVFSENCGVKISGNGSRHSTVKNLQIDFRSQYGAGSIDTVLFQNSLLRKYESLSLRAGGHRPDCLPRDDFSSNLFLKVAIDHSEYEFVNVYLNGEYWGIHALKERLNKDYLAEKYEINKNEIVILGNNGNIEYGNVQDSIVYREMINFVVNNDLNVAENYAYLESKMDIENFMTYLCSEIFIGNADWPNSNIKYWRKRVDYDSIAPFGHDGRWRWLLFDLDGGFGGSCNDVFPTFNTLTWAHQTSANFENYTQLIIALMQVDSFRKAYINKSCDLLNSSFLPKVSCEKLSNVLQKLNPEINKHINRWRYPSIATTLAERYTEIPNDTKWIFLKNKLDTFLLKRPHYTRLHMRNLWNLDDSVTIKLNVNNPAMGEIKINSIFINEDLEGVNPVVYPWVGTYFVNNSFPLVAIAKPGFKFVKWQELDSNNSTLDVTLFSDSIFTAIFEIDEDFVPELPLRINEVMAKNTNVVQDQFNEFEDWIEIYNPNNNAINLKGYFLSDEENYPIKHEISANIFVPANGFLLFWCDDQVGQGINHTNFKLKSNAGFVSLSYPNSAQLVDSIHYVEQSANVSYGREMDGSSDWTFFQSSTPERSNQTSSLPLLTKDAYLIFPNPVNTIIYFSKTISAAIFDLNGHKLIEFDSKNQISVQQLANGFYILKDKNGFTKKFVIHKN